MVGRSGGRRKRQQRRRRGQQRPAAVARPAPNQAQLVRATGAASGRSRPPAWGPCVKEHKENVTQCGGHVCTVYRHGTRRELAAGESTQAARRQQPQQEQRQEQRQERQRQRPAQDMRACGSRLGKGNSALAMCGPVIAAPAAHPQPQSGAAGGRVGEELRGSAPSSPFDQIHPRTRHSGARPWPASRPRVLAT